MGINTYYLTTEFGKWLVHSSLPKVVSIFIGLILFPLMALYVVVIFYLAFRREKKVTYMAQLGSSI
jgi:hypothetical protein